MRTRPFFVAAAAVLASSTLAACGSSTSHAASSSSTASPAPVSVTIAGGDYLGGAPVYVASADHLWASHGLQVHVANFATGVLALNALLGGQANFAFVADLPVATAILNNRDIAVDATLSDFSNWRLITKTSTGISSFASLKGKKIGVPIGTNAEYVLGLMLAAGGLSLHDVSLVNLTPTQIVPALAQGGIDAGVTFPTLYPAAQTTLGSSYQALTYTGYGEHTVLLSAKNTPASEVKDVLSTLIAADHSISADSSKAEADIVAQSGGSDPASFVKTFLPQYTQQVDLRQDLVNLLVAEGKWLKANQGLSGSDQESTVAGYLDSAPLQQIAPSDVTLTSTGN